MAAENVPSTVELTKEQFRTGNCRGTKKPPGPRLEVGGANAGIPRFNRPRAPGHDWFRDLGGRSGTAVPAAA
jgi:hypothetical protein